MMHAYEAHSNASVVQMYVSGMSATEIADKIRGDCDWIRPLKAHVLKYLQFHGVERRKTPEAMVSYYDRNDVWNKGLTKRDHDSIAQYAASRMGGANPIHSTTPKQRSYTNVVNKLRREGRLDELEKRNENISNKVSQWFASEANYETYREAYNAARDKHRVNVRAGVDKYYQRYADLGVPAPNKLANPSHPELTVKAALDVLKLEYYQQWYFGRASFDFYLPRHGACVEEHGTYWHAHHSKFPDENAVHPDKKITAKQIRERDEEKRLMLEKHGFKLVVLWEHEFASVEEAAKLLMQRLATAGAV